MKQRLNESKELLAKDQMATMGQNSDLEPARPLDNLIGY